MPETVAGTYASLAGTEIVNNVRTLTYLKNGLGPGSVNVHGDCGNCGNCSSCGCSDIITLLECPGVTGYIDPATDDAPWYTPDIPESADFLGFYVDEFEGLNSPFTRTVTESVINGGILSRSRLGTRELRWRGYLFGATCCSVQYGYQWLTRTLARFNADCQDCFGDDLEILLCCPEANENNDPFRLLKGVGLTEGPLILSQRKTCSSGCNTGCGGSCIYEVEFVMVAGQPYLYSEPIPVYDCVPVSQGTFDTVVDPDEPCPPFDCVEEAYASSQYPFTPCVTGFTLPPTATYDNACFTELSTALGPALYLTVPRSLWPVLQDVVPVITISNNAGFINMGVKIGFYQSADGNPCGELFLNPPNCAVLCDELLVGPLPPSSQFYIDGRTRKMAVICESGAAFAGEKITNGPWSWPTFSNFGFCMEIQFVNINLDGGVSVPPLLAPDLCVSLSIVPRSF